MEDATIQPTRTDRNIDKANYGELFKNAKPMTMSEVYECCKNKNETYSKETALYCERIGVNTDDKEIKDKLANGYDLSALEIVSLCNFRPKDITQAKHLIPTLDTFPEHDLREVINSFSEKAGDMDGDDFN
ncbi:hypothetical protein EIN_032740 [Entamoeba invadens IP1]|uniref:Uncharacterized protein n=1 Tax=Entamoeba invadens IP1 TaxID=370355 RepID=A0A0A1U1J6_ENTIV|nr:hypothetical protein EIN_032740 [Entamoeba invadens IP1]ELP86473.1 hypothetical protein EIN_032740 [Entamoeba invadens IP1]|eukprot:XP_004185819.1 hypothetical protein EIN_032740 [Entamoeba invadens IP1]